MKTITLGASRSTLPALVITLVAPLGAHAPERPPQDVSNFNLHPNLAFFRDYPNSNVKPCLIGSGSCASEYPPPTLCLASTQRCSADYRIQPAIAEMR